MKRKTAMKRKQRPRQTHTPPRDRSWRPSELETCERDYYNGDRMALAHTIAVCARLRVSLPDWAAEAYIAGYRNIVNYHASSWESIFGPAIPKGRHLSALRKHHQKAFLVWLKVQNRHKAGAPIDNEMFASIGKELDIGATLVSTLYSDQKRFSERTKDMLEREDKEVRAWCTEQLDAARRALGAGQPELACTLVNAVESRLCSYYQVDELPQ